MASIKKRPDGRWRARYRDPAGKEHAKHFGRKVDAENWLTTVEGSKLRGEWIDPALGKTTFQEYATKWLTTKAGVAPRTYINIDGRLRNHVIPFFEKMPVGAIRPSDIRAWVAQLEGLAPSTVKAAYLVLAQVLAQAAIDGLIGRSPCVGVELPRERHREEMHFLSAEQVNALATAIHDRYRAVIYTAAYAGLRAGELHALKVERTNLLAGTLEVVESISDVGGHLVTGPTKTGKRRAVALPRFLAKMLGEHIGRYPSQDGYVFTAAEGGPIRHRNFSRRHFKPAVERAETVPDTLRFHDLRHTCAALLIANGRHMEEVKDHFGHGSIRVTSDRYGHLFPQARIELAEGLDATFHTSAGILADSARTNGEVVSLETRSEAR